MQQLDSEKYLFESLQVICDSYQSSANNGYLDISKKKAKAESSEGKS